MRKIITILCVLFLVGCYEDKGNYEYSEISTITIDSIKESYTAQKYKTLKIKPEIKIDGALTDKLELIWEINGKVVSEEKTLNYEVLEDFSLESYFCRLTVTNSENNAKYFKTFNLNVVTPFHIGLIILSNVKDNEASLSYVPVIDDVPQEMISDVYFKENGEKLIGKPISLEKTEAYYYIGDTFINTSIGGYCVSRALMKCIELYGANKLLEEDPDFELKSVSFRNYDYYTYGAAVGVNGKIYPINGDNKYFSLPSLDPCPLYNNRELSVSDYDLSEYFIARTVGWGSRGGMLGYDNKMGRYLDFRTSTSMEDTEQMALVYARDTLGLKMFYMGMVDQDNFNHASLLHDGNYHNWLLVPSHNTTFSKTPARYNVGINSLNKDSKVVIGANYSLLYYSSNGKLYTIYLTDPSKKFDSEEIVVDGLGNNEITMLRFKDSRENVLYVGVKTGEKGKIYEIDLTSKKIVNTFDNIEGTPVDVLYKEK